ncbi:MAG: hypothetical protein M1839_001928 [Geoglossum umbratile]|nr:MAG: hypothetical protein M1839_001928 [Geoglossum umbratile]
MLEEKLIGKAQQQHLLPSALLSDDTGLQLWSQITCLPDYYQTRDEIQLLEQYGAEIAQHFVPGCTIIDLGSGDIRKVRPLLDALEATQKEVQYFALDLSRAALGESGTFDDGMAWSKTVDRPKCFLSLGSIFGNGHFNSAVARLSAWADTMRPQDRMLLGMDSLTERTEVWNSYHDSRGIFERFTRNGVLQDDPTMHRFVIRARRDVVYEPLRIYFAAGDEIDCYENFKYDPVVMRKQFASAGLSEITIWQAPSGRMYQYLLSASAAAPTAGGASFTIKPMLSVHSPNS